MTHDAFLEAIRDEPGDDAPRLAFADWLEEHGDAARSEFIRLQVRYQADFGGQAREIGQQRWVILRRQRELFLGHRHEWLGPMSEWDPGVVFQRGFVERLTLRAETFLKEADRLLRRHPVWSVRLLGLRPALTAALAALPELEHLRELDLECNALGDEGAEALAGSPFLRRLQVLDLAFTGIQDRAAQALAASSHLARLRELRLQGNRIGRHGARALAGSSQLRELAVLTLWGNPCSERAEEPLEARFEVVV
jgi:uncharacterized protein (TIGR02996 family)